MKELTLLQMLTQYNRMIQYEPEITRQMKAISDRHGIETAGMENRIKPLSSYVRKINTSEYPGKNIVEINDVIRYTFLAQPSELISSSHTILQEICSRGFIIIHVKNTWMQRMNPFKVIKASVKTGFGQSFEIQFHTPESFFLKEVKMHDLYKELRSNSISRERRLKLWKDMHELSGILTVPMRVGDI